MRRPHDRPCVLPGHFLLCGACGLPGSNARGSEGKPLPGGAAPVGSAQQGLAGGSELLRHAHLAGPSAQREAALQIHRFFLVRQLLVVQRQMSVLEATGGDVHADAYLRGRVAALPVSEAPSASYPTTATVGQAGRACGAEPVQPRRLMAPPRSIGLSQLIEDRGVLPARHIASRYECRPTRPWRRCAPIPR